MQTTLQTIENGIKGLSLHDQLWLMELLARQIRENAQAAGDLPANGAQTAANGHIEAGPPAASASESDDGGRDRATGFPIPADSPLWADKTLLQTAMRKFMQELGAVAPPIGAKALRARISQEAHLEPNELSRGIIEMREEKLRALSLY